MTTFTSDTLPTAVRKLFEANHYSVEGPVQVHGAEIDLVASPKADPFGVPIYIEVTIEHVDNAKYGKDVGKLAMVAELNRHARRLIVSSRGFSLPVKERATATQIETLTYSELFRKFEQFGPYISRCLENTDIATELRRLSDIYEEPQFSDNHGNEQATTYLTDWKNSDTNTGKWLLITGEYGTGKTALTKVLQYRWLSEYQTSPDLVLPLRIELRDFASQFNARGLLHHFLDQNGLAHLSVEFVFALLRSGRIILILDGYDEMAQYLHARERRSCLEALAQLSEGGAKGIITSRPNYFTEAEELQMYEVLYRSLEYGNYAMSEGAAALLEKEKRIDRLLETFIERYERALKDLSSEQTEKLIERVLHDDPTGRDVVLGILNRIFRRSENMDDISLSGKPVIVSYLLEVVEGLKGNHEDDEGKSLTEWQIYKLILDQLMLRDFARSPEIAPDRRRRFLQRIAIFLSSKRHPIISEEDFQDLVAREFRADIRRRPVEAQSERVDTLFADLRSSATLSRGGGSEKFGWRFSHNTRREYLVSEVLVWGLLNDDIVAETVTVSDAMKMFAASIDDGVLERARNKLSQLWAKPNPAMGRGQLLSLLWDGMLGFLPQDGERRQRCLSTVAGEPPQMSDVVLDGVKLSTETEPLSVPGANFEGAHLTHIGLDWSNLSAANFANSMLENVGFANANLRGARFDGALIVEALFVDAELEGAAFAGVDVDAISIIVEGERKSLRVLEGRDALGYLKFHGAETRELAPIFVFQHHPAFWVVDKIIRKMADQVLRQRRGLEQRGAAQQDVKLARDFVSHLERSDLLETPKGRKELVRVTDNGRAVFSAYAKANELAPELIEFFDSRPAN